MELLKIKPLNIISKKADCFKKLSRHPFYTRPNKLNILLTENKKHHVLITSEGESFYSFELNAMLELFNYDINAIKDICLENNTLTFSTVHGTYEVGTLINIEL